MLTVVRVRWSRNIPLLNWSKSNLNFNATIFSHNYHLNTLFYCWIYILHLYAYLWNESGHIFCKIFFSDWIVNFLCFIVFYIPDRIKNHKSKNSLPQSFWNFFEFLDEYLLNAIHSNRENFFHSIWKHPQYNYYGIPGSLNFLFYYFLWSF